MARLNIPDEPTFQTFPVTTAQSVFPFDFAVFQKADLNVTVDGVALSQSDFTLSGTVLENGGYQGGTVTLNVAVEDVEVVVYREVTPARASQFSPANTVPVGSVDQALNRLTANMQDIRRDVARSVKAGLGQPLPDPQDVIDAAAAVAGKANISLNNALYTGDFPGSIPIPLLDILNKEVRLSQLGVPGEDNDYSAAFAAAATYLQFKTLILDVPVFRISGVYENLSSIKFIGSGSAQTTWQFVDDLEFRNCQFFEISNVALIAAGSYAGKGLYFTGTSSSNDIHDGFAALFSQEAIAYVGTSENKQSNNKIRDFLMVECGDATHSAYRLEWSQDVLISNVDAGSATPGSYRNSIYALNCQEGTYVGGRHWNAEVAAYFEECAGWKITVGRFEESQKQNVVLDECYRMTVSAVHAHTGSEETTGTYSAILLKNGTSNCELTGVVTRSFDDDYDHLHGIEIELGCTNNLIVGGYDLDFVGQSVAGANVNGNRVFHRAPYTSDSLGPQSVQFHGVDVPASATSYLTPLGTQTDALVSGYRCPEDGQITGIRIYFDAPPTPGTYSFDMRLANASAGTVAATGGMYAVDFTTPIDVTTGQFFNIQNLSAGGAPETTMEAVFTFRPGA